MNPPLLLVLDADLAQLDINRHELEQRGALFCSSGEITLLSDIPSSIQAIWMLNTTERDRMVHIRRIRDLADAKKIPFFSHYHYKDLRSRLFTLPLAGTIEHSRRTDFSEDRITKRAAIAAIRGIRYQNEPQMNWLAMQLRWPNTPYEEARRLLMDFVTEFPTDSTSCVKALRLRIERLMRDVGLIR